jgi:sugar fermentation stimulation protein A
LEVKNVTMRGSVPGQHAVALFPDAVTTRGTKHLHTLTEIARSGSACAAQLYVVNRPDCSVFAPAEHIDATYATALRHAHAAGVQVLAYACAVSPQRIVLDKLLPLML